jgi:hypothetical protein
MPHQDGGLCPASVGNDRSNQLNQPLSLQGVVDELGRFSDHRELPRIQRGEPLLEGGDSPCSSALQNALAPRGRADADNAAVPLIRIASDEAALFQPMDDPRHRRRAHLFRGRELAESPRAPEDEDGEGRKPGGAQAAGSILSPRVTKRVDCR